MENPEDVSVRSNYCRLKELRVALEKLVKERLKAENAGLTKMLDDSWYTAMPYLVKAVPPPDWITVVRAREDARAGRVSTIDEILKAAEKGGDDGA